MWRNSIYPEVYLADLCSEFIFPLRFCCFGSKESPEILFQA